MSISFARDCSSSFIWFSGFFWCGGRDLNPRKPQLRDVLPVVGILSLAPLTSLGYPRLLGIGGWWGYLFMGVGVLCVGVGLVAQYG